MEQASVGPLLVLLSLLFITKLTIGKWSSSWPPTCARHLLCPRLVVVCPRQAPALPLSPALCSLCLSLTSGPFSSSWPTCTFLRTAAMLFPVQAKQQDGAPPSAAVLAAAAAAPDPQALPADEEGKAPVFSLGRVYCTSSSALAAEWCSKLCVSSHHRDAVRFDKGEQIEK